jgi:hypothetical protein
MVYCGTDVTELIVFHTVEDSSNQHFIMMTKHADVAIFSVECCCDSEWRYDFHLKNNSDYERVKYNIMTNIFECEDMHALMVALSELFVGGFKDILIENK